MKGSYGLGYCLVLCFACNVKAQNIDSIYFHLYTDSLKKEVHNYINVDGLLQNGRYLPLDTSLSAFFFIGWKMDG